MKLPFSKKYHKLPPTEKLAVVEGLSIMLSAGIPILEAIESLKEDTENKNTKLVLAGLSDEISSGKTLSDAISAFSDSFDLVFINIIKSGEASGNLDKVLTHLAENIKSSIETSDNIKSALFYPALVIITLVSVSFYMFAFSLPKISTVFIDLNIDLPAYSTFIFKFSLFFQKNLLYIGAGFLTSIILSIWLLRTTKIRKIFFSFLIKLPSVRTLIKYMDLSRFTKTTALLLTAGVPIIDVLDISKNVIISPKLKADIEYLKDSLTEGINLADAMKTRPKSFPSLLKQVIGVGEETGNLDKALEDISGHYEKKFTDIIKNLTVLLEPILIVLIGILVGVVLLSIIVPIYQLISQIGPQ